MRARVIRIAVAALVLSALSAMTAGDAPADPAAEAPVELVVIVHADNHVTGSPADLEAWFLRKERRWGDGALVIPINEPPEAAGRHGFDRVVLGLSPDEAARYWLDQRIRSGDNAPREIADPATAVRLVARLPSAIAYVPAALELQGVRVIGHIAHGKLVMK